MTGSNTPERGGQPKTMSSRLLTMKFMQRAAATSKRSVITGTPMRDGAGPPSAKRQKLTDSEPSTPGTLASAKPQSTDLRVVSAVLAAEERSRSEARLRSAAAGGETEWVLYHSSVNGSSNRHLQAEDSSVDSSQEDEETAEDEIWQDHIVGRRSYGDFRRKKAEAGTASPYQTGEDDGEELSEGDVSNQDAGFSQHSAKRHSQLDLKERAEEKRWQAMDRMNLKKQNHISGFSPKGAPDDRRSKAKKRPGQSFKS